jgi:hypothetical protein
LKARIDAYFKKAAAMLHLISRQKGPNPASEVQLVEIKPLQDDKAQSFQTEIKPPSRVEVVSSDRNYVQEVTQLVAAIKADTRNRGQGHKSKEGNVQPPGPSKEPVERARETQQPSHTEDIGKFHYKSKAEDSKLAEEMIKSILNQKLTDITPAHIFAISPSVRSYIINHLRNQKVEVHHLEEVLNNNKQDMVVAEDSIKLREIDVIINDTVKIRAVVDSGSQIVTLREDIWRIIGQTLDPKSGIILEGADESMSRTRGSIKDLPITVGPVTFYVQAQVVSKSPTPMLLGMPFWALANCHQDVYPDGYMTLTLVNPNPPNETIVVPTIAREYGELPPELRRVNGKESFVNENEGHTTLDSLGALADPMIAQFFQ